MKRRYRNLPPPEDAEYIGGEGFEFKPEHDRVNVGKLLSPQVELTPVGPAPTIYEFGPEHDLLRSSSGVSPQRKAAFLAELEKDNVHETRVQEWIDVIVDSSVWPLMTKILSKYAYGSRVVGALNDIERVLDAGRGPLASYWLSATVSQFECTHLRSYALHWLIENWRMEWNKIGDEAKRELMVHFAEKAERWNGVHEFLSMLDRFGSQRTRG